MDKMDIQKNHFHRVRNILRDGIFYSQTDYGYKENNFLSQWELMSPQLKASIIKKGIREHFKENKGLRRNLNKKAKA